MESTSSPTKSDGTIFTEPCNPQFPLTDKRKSRRRSSSVNLELRTNPDRPRRVSTLVRRYQAPISTSIRRRKISIDVGTRPENIRPCLKRKTELALIKRSKKQLRNKASSIRFSSTCTISVITPRPSYDPKDLKLPVSDDEDSSLNPTRERISTVPLEITPNSQLYLESIKDKEVDKIQFRAHMVFGDGLGPNVTASDGGAIANGNPMGQPNCQPKRGRRRRSLITGAASPLKIINMDEIEDDNEDSSSNSSLKENKKPSRQIFAKPDDEMKKRRRSAMLVKSPSPPQLNPPKRNRRKSDFVQDSKPKTVMEGEERGDEKDDLKRKIRRSTMCQRDFKPTEDKKINRRRKKEEAAQVMTPTGTLKQTTLAGNLFGQVEKIKGSPVIKSYSSKDVSGELAQKTIKSASSNDINSAPITPKGSLKQTKLVGNLFVEQAKKFEGSPVVRSHSSKDVSGEPIQKPLKSASSNDINAAELTPKSAKLFSIFNSKPSTSSAKQEQHKEVEIVTISEEKPMAPSKGEVETNKDSNETTLSSISTTSLSSRKRREAKNANCVYFRNSPILPPLLDDFPLDETLFTNRMKKIDDEHSINGEYQFKLRNFDENCCLETQKTEEQCQQTLKMFDAVEFKPNYSELVAGEDYTIMVGEWLRKWKGKVRKNAKREEMEKLKKKKNNRKSLSRKYSSDDDEDYEGSDDELQNPLILVGPAGVGKTAFVNALAREQNMRIIGMGPDETRTGIRVRAKMEEAMKSHRVETNPSHGHLKLFGTVYKKKEAEDASSSSSLESIKPPKTVLDPDFVQSLVVFEHIDLFFGNLDRLGEAALVELASTAMVPVVWTSEGKYPTGMERSPLVVELRKDEKKILEYIKKIIQEKMNVILDEDVIKKMANYLDYDLRALIINASFFSLKPSMPLKLPHRKNVRKDEVVWHVDIKSMTADELRKSNAGFREEKLFEERCEKMRQLYDDVDEIDGHIAITNCDIDKIDYGPFRACYGRFSRKAMSMEVLHYLRVINEVENERCSKNRRWMHRLRQTITSEQPIDYEVLSNCFRSGI